MGSRRADRKDGVVSALRRLAAGPRSWANVEVLAALGAAAVEPILSALDGSERLPRVYDPRDVEDDLCAVLSLIARKDPAPLLAALEAGRGGWAVPIALGEAGVEEAVPLLQRRLARSRGFVARWALSKAIADIGKRRRPAAAKGRRRS